MKLKKKKKEEGQRIRNEHIAKRARTKARTYRKIISRRENGGEDNGKDDQEYHSNPQSKKQIISTQQQRLAKIRRTRQWKRKINQIYK